MWRRGDSNPLPPVCETGALPDELQPQDGPPDPQSQRLGSNQLGHVYETCAPPVVLRWHESGRRDSNPRLRRGGAVRYQLRYDHMSGSGDSNPVYAWLEARCPTGWATTA